MMKRKIFAGLFALAALLTSLAGCGDESGDSDAITVQVGTMGTYSPFSYYDDDNNITGYDIEVLKLIEEKDPSLHFEFTSGAWESLFPGLDADKYQMLANQISGTAERREKYYLTENSYHTAVNQLIVKGDRDDIASFEDLVGKTIGLTVGDAHNEAAEKWNEEHGNILTIQYYNEDITTILQDIVNGRIDATLNDPAVAVSKAQLQGLDVKPTGERLEETPVFFIFKQDEAGKGLRDRIDEALKNLISSGELSALSIQWFGSDYVPSSTGGNEDASVVHVGTMGTYSPFSYYDENNNITGYDVEVVKKLEEVDSSLHFEFTSGAWESMYPGLDSDKFQMIANQIVASESNKAKYYITENSYHTAVSQIITGGQRKDIQSLDDLAGKTVGLTVGDNFFNSAVEDYNKEHSDVINIQYYQEDITTILQDIVNGRIDATINDPAVAVSKAKLQGLDVKPVGERLASAPVIFLFKQDEAGAALRDRVDAALKKLTDNGELSKLSVDWFGTDYTS